MWNWWKDLQTLIKNSKRKTEKLINEKLFNSIKQGGKPKDETQLSRFNWYVKEKL